MHNSDLIRKMSAEYADYLFDESRTMGSADFIAFPANEAELAEVIRRCAEDGIPLTAQGALTGLTGGASPERGLILNLQRMNRILGMRKDADGTVYVRVQPGLRLAQLRRALAVKDFDVRGWDGQSVEVLKEIKPGQLFFPPDPTEPTASLGGMASCNACGARSVQYGCTRAHIHALRVVLADGRIASLERGVQRAEGRKIRLPLTDGSILEEELPKIHNKLCEISGSEVGGPKYRGVSKITESGVVLSFSIYCKGMYYGWLQRMLNRELKLMCERRDIRIAMNQMVLHGETENGQEREEKP